MESPDTIVARLNNRAAADSLAAIGKPMVVPLIWVLGHDASTVHRRYAAYALGRIGDTRAVDPLVRALRQDEVLVCENAADALGRIGDPRAVRPLLRALGAATAVVQRHAAEALIRLGPAAVEPLIQELWDPSQDNYPNVLDTLARIGTPAVAALVRTARDVRGEIYSDVIDVLARIGGPHTLPRKVLAETRLSPAQRMEALKFLLSYHRLPPLRRFCLQVLEESDTAAREGARTVLAEMEKDVLVRPCPHEPTIPAQELLRAARNGAVCEPPETLLRAGEPTTGRPARWRRRLRLSLFSHK